MAVVVIGRVVVVRAVAWGFLEVAFGAEEGGGGAAEFDEVLGVEDDVVEGFEGVFAAAGGAEGAGVGDVGGDAGAGEPEVEVLLGALGVLGEEAQVFFELEEAVEEVGVGLWEGLEGAGEELGAGGEVGGVGKGSEGGVEGGAVVDEGFGEAPGVGGRGVRGGREGGRRGRGGCERVGESVVAAHSGRLTAHMLAVGGRFGRLRLGRGGRDGAPTVCFADTSPAPPWGGWGGGVGRGGGGGGRGRGLEGPGRGGGVEGEVDGFGIHLGSLYGIGEGVKGK